MLNGGEVVIETMLSRGVDHVYFVAGGTYVTVLEALSRPRKRRQLWDLKAEVTRPSGASI